MIHVGVSITGEKAGIECRVKDGVIATAFEITGWVRVIPSDQGIDIADQPGAQVSECWVIPCVGIKKDARNVSFVGIAGEPVSADYRTKYTGRIKIAKGLVAP